MQIPLRRREIGIIKGECCVAVAQCAKEQAVLDAFVEKTEVGAYAKPRWEICNVVYAKKIFRDFFKLKICIISLLKIILAVVG